MKTWSKSDLIGLAFLIFGIVALIFSNSSVLTTASLLISAVLLLNSVYGARYDFARYRDILCHYQAALSCSPDGWIAWNIDNEYIGSSKKLRSFFGIEKMGDIYISDILAAVDSDDAGDLSLDFNRLKKQGLNFKLVVKTAADGSEIEVRGSRMIVNGLETIALWCSNITAEFNFVNSAEKELAEAKKRENSMREILDALPLPIWRRDRNLRIIYCNQTYADYLNVSVEKITADNAPLAPGNLFGQGHSLAENAKKSARPQTISQSISVNGVRKKISMRECPTNGGGLIGYATDITSEEALAANLDKAEAANCEVLENLSTAIAIFGENTRLTFFNDAYRRLMKLEVGWLRSKPTYGETLDELRNNRQLPEQADYQAFKKTQLALFKSLSGPTQELAHLPNGKTLRLTIAPYPLGGLLFIYEDVTDSLSLQRRNDSLLAAQKEIVNNLCEGITIYGSDNRLKVANDAMKKIWKLGDGAPKGTHISETLDLIKDDLDYDEDWKEFRENAVSALTDRIVKTGKLRKKDGSTILFSYFPLPDGSHMHSFVDITGSCELEKTKIERDSALKTAKEQRFEFVSGVSLELKEPLSALIGFSELMLRQYFGVLNEKQLEHCQCIFAAAVQLRRLLDDLLEMSAADLDSANLDVSSFSITDAIEEVLANLEKRIEEKDIGLIKTYPEQKVEFAGDKTRVKQAVYAILTDALRAAPQEGKIDIIVAADEEKLKIIIKDARFSRGDVKNSKRSRGFIRAETSDGASAPFAKSLIESCGGTLRISSTAGSGTSVVCFLPLKSEKKPPEAALDAAGFQDVVNS
ncbi:MAG: PAS-domain containing protein [Holosporaceae bacterium]|jgi:PAS domain-containing protein|nr:PAS-domain containing protein [Holosporaceae bacterium]